MEKTKNSVLMFTESSIITTIDLLLQWKIFLKSFLLINNYLQKKTIYTIPPTPSYCKV